MSITRRRLATNQRRKKRKKEQATINESPTETTIQCNLVEMTPHLTFFFPSEREPNCKKLPRENGMIVNNVMLSKDIAVLVVRINRVSNVTKKKVNKVSGFH